MIQDVRLPEVSENVQKADVVKVLVAVGDAVNVDQPLLEVETEKAVFELPSPLAGRVAEILVEAGRTVSVGEAVLPLSMVPTTICPNAGTNAVVPSISP